MADSILEDLAGTLVLGHLMETLRNRWGAFELVAHWKQGEFHHDVVLRVAEHGGELPGPFLVVSTNCNGGVKEVLCLGEEPDRYGLWHDRCPENSEFEGRAPALLATARTLHWFDPCELLVDDARSEYREEHRARQRGGGWRLK